MQRMILLIKKTLYMMDLPQKILCLIVFVLTIVGSGLECLGVSAIVPLVSVIQNPGTILASNFFRSHEFLARLNYNQVVTAIGGGVVFLYVFKNLYFVFMSWMRVKFASRIQREMSVKMLTSYLSRGYQFFLTKNFGEFNRGVSGDTSAVYAVLNAVFRLASETLTIFLICVFMFFSDWQMALTMVVMALICLLLIYFLFRKNMYKAGVEGRKYGARASQALIQVFSGVKDVLLLRKQRYFVDEYEKNQISVQKAQCKTTIGGESPSYIIEGLCVSGLMIVVCIRIMSGSADENFIAVLASFAVGAFRILPSLGKISIAINSLMNSLPSIDALYEQIREAEAFALEHSDMLFEIEHVTDRWGLISKGREFNTEEKRNIWYGEEKFHDTLEVKNITFKYNNELGNVLENIDLSIKKGQAIALIGASGAGKSTLADIILGLLIPQMGAVYMDGTKISDIPELWSETVGYVPQSVFLSDDSIRKNVAFGENEKEIDDDRVCEALERAELSQFIASLPEGMETSVGDRGVRLSGGQRQRIAIARALYHRPEILVLDEATSALDNDTEEAIMSAIDTLQGQVTLVIVAHRLTTVRKCDLIYEVRDKQIIMRDKAEVLGKKNS